MFIVTTDWWRFPCWVHAEYWPALKCVRLCIRTSTWLWYFCSASDKSTLFRTRTWLWFFYSASDRSAQRFSLLVNTFAETNLIILVVTEWSVWVLWHDYCRLCCVCCWLCCVQSCEPAFSLRDLMTYVLNWREDLKYRIRPEMTACSWQDVNIQDLTNYPRNKAPRTLKLRPMQSTRI